MGTQETLPEEEKHDGRASHHNSLTDAATHGISDAASSSIAAKVEDEKRNAESETSQDTEDIKPMTAMGQATSFREELNEEDNLENGAADDSPTGPPGARYLDAKELAWVSFAFTLATSMLAIDVSIIGAGLHADAGNLLTFLNSNCNSQNHQPIQQPR